MTVCYWAIDDPRKVAFAKWWAMASEIPITSCLQPTKIKSDDKLKKYNEAREVMGEWISSGRLSVKGEEIGNSTTVVEKWVRDIQEKTGNNVILIVDSFNNIESPGLEERVQFSNLSRWFRKTPVTMGFTAISTMECNKLGVYQSRPRLAHLYGSAKMQFDSKFVGMVYNDLHEKREQAKMVWSCEDDIKMPVIELSIEKNKLEGYKDTIAYHFHPTWAKIVKEMTIQAATRESQMYMVGKGEEITFEEGLELKGDTPGAIQITQ